jgi:hypothetical protein
VCVNGLTDRKNNKNNKSNNTTSAGAMSNDPAMIELL